MIKVRAIQMGFYGDVRRRPGDVFTIQTEQEYSSRWMQKVPDDTPECRTTGQQWLDRECDGRALGVRARTHLPPEPIDDPPQHLADFDPFERSSTH